VNCKKLDELKPLPIIKQKLPSKEIKKEHQKLMDEVTTPWWKVLKKNYDLNQLDFDYINEVLSNS